MNCKYRILISWVIVLSAAIGYLIIGEKFQYALFISFAIAVVFRDVRREKFFWKTTGSKSSSIIKVIFFWVLLWLGYILYNFHTASPVGTFRMSNVEWLLFCAPIAFTYIYYEIQLFNNCEKYYQKKSRD